MGWLLLFLLFATAKPATMPGSVLLPAKDGTSWMFHATTSKASEARFGKVNVYKPATGVDAPKHFAVGVRATIGGRAYVFSMAEPGGVFYPVS